VPAAMKKQLPKGRYDPWKKNMAILEFDYGEVLTRMLTPRLLRIFGTCFAVLSIFFGLLYYVNSWQLGLIEETKEKAKLRKEQMKVQEKKRKQRIKRQMKTVQ